MATIKVVEQDTGTQLYWACKSTYQNAVIDTITSARLKWRDAAGNLVTKTMTIVDAGAGLIGYHFSGTDFYKPVGKKFMTVEIEITLSGGDILSCIDYIQIYVRSKV